MNCENRFDDLHWYRADNKHGLAPVIFRHYDVNACTSNGKERYFFLIFLSQGVRRCMTGRGRALGAKIFPYYLSR